MRNVAIVGMTGRGVQISTDLSAIERRVGLACAVAKLNRGLFFLNMVFSIPKWKEW